MENPFTARQATFMGEGISRMPPVQKKGYQPREGQLNLLLWAEDQAKLEAWQKEEIKVK